MGRLLRAAITALLLTAPLFTDAQTSWKPFLSVVSFKIKNAGFTVEGNIKGFKGQLVFDPDNMASSSLSASVETSTINTGNSMRDDHLRNADYFDAAQFKTIEITSVKLDRVNSGFEGKFNVSIKGKILPVIIPFTFTRNGDTAVFEGKFTINRRDFGVGSHSLILSDQVIVNIIVNARK